MTDRTELLEAALDSLPDGIALLDTESRIVFWNRAAEAITGYAGVDLLSRKAPAELEPLLASDSWQKDLKPGSGPGHGALVQLHHRMGHDLPAMARTMVLRDGMGNRSGSTVVFHPAESLDALPHGDYEETQGLEACQADMEDRLSNVYDDYVRGGLSFGVLWISVDQAHQLRKTHGKRACDSMMDVVQRTLARGLRPGEEIGRWGDDEFLVVSHERTAEMLTQHAQTLAGLARTAEFRWWGDRVSITTSIGAAQVTHDEALAQLLFRAQSAMLTSMHAGGNQVTQAPAPGGYACSPS